MHLLSFEMATATRLFLAVLLHFTWQATLIVGLVAMARILIHPRHFSVRYLLSVTALVATLLAPIVTIGYYVTNEAALIALTPPTAMTENIASPEYLHLLADGTGPLFLLETQFHNVFSWFDSHRFFWLGCWSTGFVLLLIRLSISLDHCLRLRRTQKPLPKHLQRLAQQLKEKLNITRKIVVASSCEITQAVATGIIKPVVLIPTAWLTQLPISAIEAVLAHELAHVKRWDLWVNWLQRLAETVFFFHPMVWWLSNRISNEREVCCDQLAIQVTGQPLQYIETLAHVAGNTDIENFEFKFGTAFIGGQKMNLLRRAKMILEPGSINSPSPLRMSTLFVCAGMLISYGSYAYCSPPEPATSTQEDEAKKVLIHIEDAAGNELHDTFADILISKQSEDLDPQELARQLRALADRLDPQSQGYIKRPKAGRMEFRTASEGPKRMRVELHEHNEHAHGDHAHAEHSHDDAAAGKKRKTKRMRLRGTSETPELIQFEVHAHDGNADHSHAGHTHDNPARVDHAHGDHAHAEHSHDDAAAGNKPKAGRIELRTTSETPNGMLVEIHEHAHGEHSHDGDSHGGHAIIDFTTDVHEHGDPSEKQIQKITKVLLERLHDENGNVSVEDLAKIRAQLMETHELRVELQPHEDGAHGLKRKVITRIHSDSAGNPAVVEDVHL